MKERIRKLPVAALVLLAVLAAALAAMSLRLYRLGSAVSVEAARTPTPEPPWGNVQQQTPDPAAPTPPPVLKAGAQGDAVLALQQRLQALGYYTASLDGQYGAGTRDAVRLFQQVNSLDADGIAGPETMAALLSDAALPNPTATPSPAPTAAPSSAPAAAPAAPAESPGDGGLPLLVNASHPLPDGYAPAGLVKMRSYCDSSVVSIKGSDIQGERTAVDALMVMLRAAKADGIGNWQVSAGYRSISYQTRLFNNKVAEYRSRGFSTSRARSAASRSVALPGTSEHHTGLAFDITVPGVSFKGTRQQKWLAEHCWDYGFIIRYAQDKEDITGIIAEPWHIRYVGQEHARRMREENLCLEEYIQRCGV